VLLYLVIAVKGATLSSYWCRRC